MSTELFVQGLVACVLGCYLVGVSLPGPESEIARLLMTLAGLVVAVVGMLLVLVAVA